jgi:hypothetical protein
MKSRNDNVDDDNSRKTEMISDIPSCVVSTKIFLLGLCHSLGGGESVYTEMKSHDRGTKARKQP